MSDETSPGIIILHTPTQIEALERQHAAKEHVLAMAYQNLASIRETIGRLEGELGIVRVDPVQTLLTQIEWEGSETHHICPACHLSRAAGHARECPLAALIGEAR